jgi:hypothetical protein
MVTPQDITIEGFTRARSRRRVGIIVALALLLGGAVLAWWLVPRPCDTLARDMFASGGMTGPDELAADLRAVGITERQCFAVLRSVDRADENWKVKARTLGVRELLEGRVDEATADKFTRRLRR